ncbi:hypothetical protein BC835DRAFT_1281299, partial [Cytidiella melzeri]
DLEDAVAAWRRAENHVLDGHPALPQLDNFGPALQARLKRLGNLEDVQGAIMSHSRAVETTPDGHRDTPAIRLMDLGHALQTRFQQLGHLEDLEEALAASTRVVKMTPDGQLSTRLNSLGHVLLTRFERLEKASNMCAKPL